MPIDKYFDFFLYAFPKGYSIKVANITSRVLNNGLVEITEEVTFILNGRYGEVYLSKPMSMSNYVVGNKPQIYGKPEISCSYGEPKLYKGYPTEFACSFERKEYNGKEVTLKVKYYVAKGLNVYEDVAELHQKLWGEEWEVWLPKLYAKLILPAPIESYYVHPKANKVRVANDTIFLEVENIPPHNYLEVRLLFSPKESLKEYANVFMAPMKSSIYRVEENYEQKTVVKTIIFFIAFMLSISSPLILLWIYYRYGKEASIPPILFEREPPYPTKPYVVDFFVGGDVNDVSLNGFLATFMDLVRMKFFSLKSVTKKKGVLFKKQVKEFFIRANYPLSKAKEMLTEPEFLVYEVFYKRIKEWKSLEKLRKEIAYDKKVRMDFHETFNVFKKKVEKECMPMLTKFFNFKGVKYAFIVGVLAFLSVFLFTVSIECFSSLPGYLTRMYPLILISMVLPFLIPSIVLILPYRIFGKFSEEGLVFYRKWQAFKRFLTDVSLIKKYPPDSLVIWEEYLVYATALGIADEVVEILRDLIPDVTERSMFVDFYYTSYRGFRASVSMVTSSRSTSGGFGGTSVSVGGGFGGGGGAR
ncbi:MAG: DUF2207 domain-containing protein [Candidatus Aenigmarchaeota archaeon]|nr:DUF2207 domain-containing protein [Candidatus Aenigmarchaeota archaeon]